MKRSSILVLLLLLLSSVLFAQSENYVFPFMHKATTPITVDGILDEWNFCFPITMNQSSIPAGSRSHAWFPVDNDDCSGTIMMMWDDAYLYFAANIRDDHPGVLPEPGWRADAVEFYMANYDIGTVPWQQESASGYPDTGDGKYAVQIACYYDAALDVCDIYQWNPVARTLITENTKMKGVVWPNEDGYTIEGQILWNDFESPNGNVFAFEGGETIPCTWSIYDVDEYDVYDFQGYQFSEDAYPPWAGPGRNWQVLDVRGEREDPYYQYSAPYLKQANGEITIDGVLDEWNFVFPVDMNQSSIPPDSRAYDWLPVDDADLSGPLMFMWDNEFLYFAAEVRDDVPGIIPEPGWRADGVELYLGNYDIGELGALPEHTGFINEGDLLDVQIGFYYDSYADSVEIYLWGPNTGNIESEATTMSAHLWADETGYTIEGRVLLQDIADMVDLTSATRTFDFANNVGSIFPATYSLFDVDEIDVYDFQGYQYANAAGAPWQGPSMGGWPGVEITGKCLLEDLDWLWANYTDVQETPGAAVPTAFNLSQNYPNPFNPVTAIQFSVIQNGNVSLKIFNTRGELVKTLLSNEYKTTGNYSMSVDMSDVSSGIYFYTLEQGAQKLTNKMMLVK